MGSTLNQLDGTEPARPAASVAKVEADMAALLDKLNKENAELEKEVRSLVVRGQSARDQATGLVSLVREMR